MQKKKSVHYKLKPLNSVAKKSKKMKGSVVGGNLVTLQSSLGTSFELQSKGKILFFEDIGERAYRGSRILEHMGQLNFFKGARAVVLGQFTGGREPQGKSLVPELLKTFAQSQKIPIFSGLKAGHGKNQHPVPLNTQAELQCGLNPYVEIHTGAYADATNDEDTAKELEHIRQGVKYAASIGLIVNAGHGLHYHNVKPIAAMPEIYELNIGHAIIARAAIDGLDKAVRDMKRLMLEARA